MQLFPRLDADQRLDLVQVQLRERLEVLHLTAQVAVVLAVDPGQAPQDVLRREIEPGFALDARQRRVVLVESDLLRGRRVGFSPALFQVAEDLDGLVGRGGPDDAELRERDREQDELRAEVKLARRGRWSSLDICLEGG